VLVYRATSRRDDAAGVVDALVERMARASASPIDHDGLRALLIDAGIAESALLDAASPMEDERDPIAAPLEAVMSSLADAFVLSWDGASARSPSRAREALTAVRRLLPSAAIELTVPEGFAYYGLFPETYLAAARTIASRYAPEHAVVIGIRSIGTTLSAVVAATFRARDIPATRITVRPRGHPFDRELRLSRAMTRELARWAGDPRTLFVVVDEGPGISGSSFACVAERLVELGALPQRIVLAPSWDPPADTLSTERGRRCWTRHARVVGDVRHLHPARLDVALHLVVEIVADLSAGAWRSICYGSPSDYPAVQPQHERRKLLTRAASGEPILLKFEGLGSLGAIRRDRAIRLGDAGFGPPVLGFADGFLATPWIDGRPMQARDVDARFVDHLGAYLAWLRCREQTGEAPDHTSLRTMAEVNIAEGLGEEWRSHLRRIDGSAPDGGAAPAVRIDGRMLPHEWLRTASGYTKTDALAHHDDHFYPGATDVAWDLAGACVELELEHAAEEALIRAYHAHSGDGTIAARLPFHRRTYLAFRLGYSTLAAQSLGDSPDARAMRDGARRYAELLRRELARGTAAEHGQSYATDT